MLLCIGKVITEIVDLPLLCNVHMAYILQYTLISFAACPLSDLVQGLEVQLVTDGCDSGFVGGVITSAGIGRACYNGTATGSIAVYACNCPSLYRLEGTATRICQSDGTWSGAMPQCLPECRFFFDYIAFVRLHCPAFLTP